MDSYKTIRLLERIILLESEKHYTEMDADLISECVEFLLELQGVVVNKEKVAKKKKELVELMKEKAKNSSDKNSYNI